MVFLKIISIGLITVVAALVVKQIKPELAIFITLTGGFLILFEIVGVLSTVIDTFLNLSQNSGISKDLFQIILKIIGIGYLTEFTANICSDAGMNSVADKVLLGGKVIILLVSLPIINTLIEIITNLLDLC